MTWMPKKRNITYEERSPEIPPAVYQDAVAAKRFYNENWEFWVWSEAQHFNRPLAEVEDACIRGIQKAIYRTRFVYGDAIGKWYENFLDMGDIFRKVSHPEYLKQLGDN